MKRRGTSRRQVLDLDTSSSSPKRSWQTKYQQVYMDHLNSSTAPTTATPTVAVAATENGSDSCESRLPQLVGYTSDSEGDEPKNPAGDIDSKVQDFLKEISDIVPSTAPSPNIGVNDENSRDSIKRLKSKGKRVSSPSLPGSADTPQSTPVQSAWQECYDENSGCYYFWNIETNEVTWEMPEALKAYHVAVEQWNAHQLLLAQQAAGGVIPGFMNQPSNQQQQKKQTSSKTQEKSKNKRSKPSDCDSEDEKIELITSYGPNSDEDDSDSGSLHSHSTKKKKVESSKSSKKEKKKKEKEIAIGPQLPPGYIVPVEIKETKPATKEVPDLDSEMADAVSNEPKSKKTKKEIGVKVNSRAITSNAAETDIKDPPVNKTQQDVSRISALQRLKNLKNKTSDDSSSEDNDSSDSSTDSKKDVVDKVRRNNEDVEEEEEEEEDEDDDVEDSILERLKNQAKILKELGGEIPEEIKELLDTNSDSEKDKVETFNQKEKSQTVKNPVEMLEKEVTQEENIATLEETDTIKKDSDIIVVESNTDHTKEVEIIDDPKDVLAEIEVDSLPSAPKTPNVHSEVNKRIPPEKAPTSFSLIAGYGNEDDSEPEEEKLEDDKSKVNGKPTPLFPIISAVEEEIKIDQQEIKIEKPPIKASNMKVIKLSAKAKELIHSSTTTAKARATEFIATAEGLKPAASVVKENEVLNNEPKEFPEPVKKVSRKKRLEVPVFKKQEKKPVFKVEACNKESSSEKKLEICLNETEHNISEEPLEKVEIATKTSSTAYTSTWAYNTELKGGEYRGFGYGHDYESDKKIKATKKGMIQFVKADTLMPMSDPVVNIPEKKLPAEEIKQEDESSNPQKEQARELAQVITEKVKFLCEGKDVVPPVQVMAIQLETLMTAHNAGGLSVQYLWQWLTSLDGQLASLEQAAAPQGWLCQWDRSYKRYFYRNEVTGSIQWEYPEVSVAAAVVAAATEPPLSTQSQGGEEAMELCDSPPPPQPPSTPPPPRISISRTPSPGVPDEPAPPLPPLPPPPPVISEQPPLPPMPPSESPPPPPLPPSPPPPPPPPIISIAPGEPLPPGVDIMDELFEGSRPPLPAVPPPPPKTPPPPPPPPDITEPTVEQPVYSMGYDVPMHYETYQMQPVPTDYNAGVYPYSGANSGGGEYVIARPPASNPAPPPPVTSLATELDSFYSEVAALDPPLPPPEPSPSPPSPPVSSPPPQPQPTMVADAMGKKKKKTKLAPGLALKKKGVSSLVAKWQQVQQDVRREAANDETQS